MDIVKHLPTLGAGIAATVAVQKIIDLIRAYLHIYVDVRREDEKYYSAMTTVENKRIWRKKLEYSFLLVAPFDESPLDTMNDILKFKKIEYNFEITNDFKSIDQLLKQDVAPIYTNNSQIFIPLPFYYSENIRIADEMPRFRSIFDTTKLNKSQKYSVRFFIYHKFWYHRSTHDSFVL